MYELDVCQRKHLRQIIKMQWPTGKISNLALYKCCKLTPLSVRVVESRWTMLGNVLTSDDLNPAQLSLQFAIKSNKLYKGRIGKHQFNLLRTLKEDLKLRNLKLETIEDLDSLKSIASDRKKWKELKVV